MLFLLPCLLPHLPLPVLLLMWPAMPPEHPGKTSMRQFPKISHAYGLVILGGRCLLVLALEKGRGGRELAGLGGPCPSAHL